VTATAPYRDDEEFTITVYPAEYTAASAVANYLSHSLGCKVNRICNSDELPLDRSLEGNLILIGGPNHNRISRIFLERVPLPFHFEHCDLIDEGTGTRYAPRIENNSIVEDYGLVVLTANPFKPSSRLVMLLGCRTYGCIASAHVLIDERVRTTSNTLKRFDSTTLIVKTDVVGQYATRIEIVFPGPPSDVPIPSTEIRNG